MDKPKADLRYQGNHLVIRTGKESLKQVAEVVEKVTAEYQIGWWSIDAEGVIIIPLEGVPVNTPAIAKKQIEELETTGMEVNWTLPTYMLFNQED